MMRAYWVGSLAFLCACALGISRVDASMMHSDVAGNTVDFTGIEETSPTGDPLPLFGQPTASGDSLDFNPMGLSALAEDGGSDTTDGKLFVMVEARPLHTIETLSFLESGLVTLLTQSGDPIAATTSSVDIDVLEVDGSPITQYNLPPQLLSYTPSDGDYQHSVDATGPLFSSGWTGDLDVDLDAALTAGGIPFSFGATKVAITLDNAMLASTTELGSSAFIDKKDLDIFAETAVIPEPSSCVLAFLAVALGAMVTRRRGTN